MHCSAACHGLSLKHGCPRTSRMHSAGNNMILLGCYPCHQVNIVRRDASSTASALLAAPGEVLLHQGREITSIYFLLEGQVQLQIRPPRSSALLSQPHPYYQTAATQQQQQEGQPRASMAYPSSSVVSAATPGEAGVGAGGGGGVGAWDRAQASSIGPAGFLGMFQQQQMLVVGAR